MGQFHRGWAHIPFFALKNYLDIVGADKSIVVEMPSPPPGWGREVIDSDEGI